MDTNLELELIKKAVEVNIALVQELLKQENILEKDVTIQSCWGEYPVRNAKNTELRQRMKALRKDMIRLEKLM